MSSIPDRSAEAMPELLFDRFEDFVAERIEAGNAVTSIFDTRGELLGSPNESSVVEGEFICQYLDNIGQSQDETDITICTSAEYIISGSDLAIVANKLAFREWVTEPGKSADVHAPKPLHSKINSYQIEYIGTVMSKEKYVVSRLESRLGEHGRYFKGYDGSLVTDPTEVMKYMSNITLLQQAGTIYPKKAN